MEKPSVSIIIPVFNEEAIITDVLNELIDYKFPFPFEIIIVDDGSKDSSLQKISSLKNDSRITVIAHGMNRGYGASLKTGIRKSKGEYIVTYDGDGQFIPKDIVELYKKLQGGKFDAIFGERKNLSSGSPLWRAPGKFIIRSLINLLIGVSIRDVNCGLRIVKREIILKYLHLCSDRFSFSTTSMMVLVSRGYQYAFLPIEVRNRKEGKSMVQFSSGLSTLYLMIRLVMLFNPLKIFLSAGVIFILLGFGWGANYFVSGRGLSVGALLFMLIGILSVFLGLIADQISEIRKSQFENNSA